MAQYTNHLNLYKPSRLDSGLAVDQTLAQNFQNLEEKLGTSLIGVNGETFDELKKRLDTEHNANKTKIESNTYHHKVSVRYERDDVTGTDYILTTIKHTGDDGGVINLNRGFSGDDPNVVAAEPAREFANRNSTTITTNASTYNVDTNTRRSADIYNGESLSGNPVYYRWELGVKADNTLKAYPPDTPYQDLINDGVIHSFAGFCPFIIDGVQTLDDYHINVSANSYEYHPRNAIAQFANKDIMFLTCDGRNENNKGMKIEDMARILDAEGVDFAYNLDGGGSAQTVVRGSLVNRPIDDNGFTERHVPDFIYFSKDIVTERDKDLSNANKDAGVARFKTELNKRRIDLLGQLPIKVNVNTTPSNLNDIKTTGFYWGHSTLTEGNPSTPSGISWGILHFQYDDVSALQVAFPFDESVGAICTRRTDNAGGWHYWREM